MNNKPTIVVTVVLFAIGLFLFLSAVFNILPVEDKTIIFLALACFIISWVIHRINRERRCN